MLTFSRMVAIATFLAAVLPGMATAADGEKKYTFYHILWSMTDPVAQFHVKAGEAYMVSHPEVEINYVGPEAYDPAEHAKFLDTVLNANPDGIAMHISSADALLSGLKPPRSVVFHSFPLLRTHLVLKTTPR